MIKRFALLIPLTLFVASANDSYAKPCKNLSFPGKAFESVDDLAKLGWDKDQLSSLLDEAKSYNPAAFLIATCGQIVVQTGDIAKPYRMHSIRKSLLNSLYGIYWDRRKIDLDKNLENIGITDTTPLTTAEKKATIRHLLMSRSGVYLEAASETKAMKEKRPKRSSHPPGTFFYYNNWDFNALGTIFTKLTKKDVFKAFEEDVSQRVGMQDFHSRLGRYKTEKNSAHSSYKFKLSARDLARFGLLYLSEGKWSNSRILSKEWINQSLTLNATDAKAIGTKSGFGYLWWGVFREGYGLKKGIYAASGLGTQKLFIIPQIDTVVVFLKDTSNYGKENGQKILVGTSRLDRFLGQVVQTNRFYSIK